MTLIKKKELNDFFDSRLEDDGTFRWFGQDWRVIDDKLLDNGEALMTRDFLWRNLMLSSDNSPVVMELKNLIQNEVKTA